MDITSDFNKKEWWDYEILCEFSKNKCCNYKRFLSYYYLLSRIDDILDQLSGNIWFIILDLKSEYWQIKIRPQAREITAFSAMVWQFKLCLSVYAPATFEWIME